MKVGIETVHDSSNLGSYLQALGMQELVKEYGDEPYFIKTRSEFSVLCLFMGYNNAPSVRSLRGFIKFILRSIINFTSIAPKIRKYKRYKNDREKLDNIISIKEANRIGLDILLMGSDEIWNSNQPAFQNPLLYGAEIKATRKCAYAISVGNMDAKNWLRYPELLNHIKNLDAIIPRDTRTSELLKDHGLSVEKTVCDPTLQVDIRRYMADNFELPKKDYIVVYAYSVGEKMKNNIIRFAAEHALKTVAVSLPNAWCDEYINCSPLEFGTILSGAKYVYTSTFHGTIFSALYHTNFVSMNKMPKVAEVVTLMGIDEYAVSDDCEYPDFEQKLLADRNYNEFEDRIKIMKDNAKEIYMERIKNAMK